MSTEQTEWKVDRTHWPAGPWNDEPDKLNWKTAAGLPGMIVRNRLGGLCGYVAVTKNHPLYETHYGEVEGSLSVHGGLTYSDKCTGPVCHIPEPGEPDDVWWFGFDCVHSGDWHPPSYASSYRDLPNGYEAYRDLAYVRAEVEMLAEQLAPSDTSTEEVKP